MYLVWETLCTFQDSVQGAWQDHRTKLPTAKNKRRKWSLTVDTPLLVIVVIMCWCCKQDPSQNAFSCSLLELWLIILFGAAKEMWRSGASKHDSMDPQEVLVVGARARWFCQHISDSKPRSCLIEKTHIGLYNGSWMGWGPLPHYGTTLCGEKSITTVKNYFEKI